MRNSVILASLVFAAFLSILCPKPPPGQAKNTSLAEGFETFAAAMGRPDAVLAQSEDTLAERDRLSNASPAASLDSPLFQGKTVAPAKERRAIWITRYDWTILPNVPSPEQIDQMVANIARAGFNTIFFQVRAAGDAYYTPGLEPWASRLTGSGWETLGQDPGWDPLARMLEKGHAAGLEVHAYINIYPVWLPPADAAAGELWPKATNPINTFDRLTYHPEVLYHPGQYNLTWTWRQYYAVDRPMLLAWNQYLWASPGVDAVRDHVLAVVADIVGRYAVDGVHLDLVRYAGHDYSFDPSSNAAAGSVKTAARDQWQRDRITDLVQRVSARTKSIRPKVMISAAVWPYYTDNWGWGVTQGYSDFYQDSKGWLANGAVDAIVPMLYGGVTADFNRWQTLLADFQGSSQGRPIYPGISADFDDFGAIAQRIAAARQAGSPGHAIFSYGALDAHGYWDDMASGPYAP